MVLDSFPFGGSFQFLSLAISVGTPVITLRSGVQLSTPKDDLREVRMYIQQASQRGGNALLKSNPLSQLLRQGDVPWTRALSSVAGFFDRAGLGQHFVANSTAEYFQLATHLALHRESAYGLRVRILEAIDRDGRHFERSSSSAAPSSAKYRPGTTAPDSSDVYADEQEEDEAEEQTSSEPPPPPRGNSAASSSADCGHCVDDLGRFLVSVATPYARARVWHSDQLQQATNTHTRPAGSKASRADSGAKRTRGGDSGGAEGKKTASKAAHEQLDASYRDYFSSEGFGAIIQ